MQSFRDALFASGWKLIDVTKLEEIAIQPETVNVAAHYRENGRNVYARFTQEPGGRTRERRGHRCRRLGRTARGECRVRIHSIHFEHDRPVIKLIESEPTLRKLATLIKSKNTPTADVQGHMDNIGEAGAARGRCWRSAARSRSPAG